MLPGKGEVTEDGCRGIAFFMAFDPWSTSLRCPIGSFRYFDLAERSGVIGLEEAATLSRRLIRHASEMSSLYKGHFQSFFDGSQVKTILAHIDELDHLSESGLALGGAWADRLYQTCPFPVVPRKHLELLSFRSLADGDIIEALSGTPWLAWVEAVDMVCLGAWMGFTPEQILRIVDGTAQKASEGQNTILKIEHSLLGQKVVMPMFANGFQGVVFGFFHDVPKAQKEPIITTLAQFGQTLADAYSVLRRRQLVSALDDELDDETLAREVVHTVSPVAKVIVRREGRCFGYKLCYEHTYWAGYQPLAPDEMNGELSSSGFTVTGPEDALIAIEPLTDIPNFPADFMRMRLESCLSAVLGTSVTTKTGRTLPLSEVQNLRTELSSYTKDEGSSQAKLRQLYVATKIEDYWSRSKVTVTNSEMKRFLEDELKREVKNGYQVTSFSLEIEKLFDNKVLVTKNRNAVSLSWNKGP